MLKTPWLKTYEKLGFTIPTPASLTLAHYLERNAKERPESPTLHFFGRSWTYAETYGLLKLGAGPGDVVGFHMPSRQFFPKP